MVKHPLQQARFLLTAARDEQLPPPGPPEVAFAGRSNAGKSSAINALANRVRLAFTSKTPGRTQQINFFRLRNGALLADLPGYGYAAVPQHLKQHWQEFLARYVATRQSLVGLVLVVDARHGLGELDLRLLQGFVPSGRPVLILATKMDKLSSSAQRAAERSIAADIGTAFPAHSHAVAVIGFSAVRRVGIEAAETLIGSWLGVDEASIAAAQAEDEKEKALPARGVPQGPKHLARG